MELLEALFVCHDNTKSNEKTINSEGKITHRDAHTHSRVYVLNFLYVFFFFVRSLKSDKFESSVAHNANQLCHNKIGKKNVKICMW